MSSSRRKDGSQFWRSDGPELLTELTEVTTQIRILQARQLDLVAQLGRIQAADAAGYSSLPAFLVDTQRFAMRRARQLVAHAEQITETLTPTGHVSPAPLPTAREAVREGVIDADHLEMIAKAVEAVPASVSAADREVLEQSLTGYARIAHPRAVGKLGEALVSHLDPDGQEPDAKELAEPANSLRYHRTRTGRMKLTADIDAEAGEELEGLITALGAPQPLAPGIPDPRHQTQRYGDAFTEVIHLAAKAEDLPTQGGQKPHLTITLDHNALLEGIGTATLESGTPLSPYAARRVACDAEVIPVVLNGESVPLDLGRKYRCISVDQRITLIARDKGCAFPDCDRPPRWCDGHHVQHWADGGLTDLDNLVLLCRRHHRLIHHSEWHVRITAGIPEFIPPRWRDPDRKPLRNRLRRARE